ncbi:MAG: hypothetical protein Q4E36_04085 [Bacillota bacterium]|nr:hypothetical protein [Bacillota bacterium]
MKKLYLLLALVFFLTACQKNPQPSENENIENEKQVEGSIEDPVDQGTKVQEDLKKLSIKSGQDLEYSSLGLEVLNKEGDFVTLEIPDQSMEPILDLLKTMDQVEDGENAAEPKLEDLTIKVSLTDSSYLLLDGGDELETYYSYLYEKGQLGRYFKTEKALNKDLLEVVILDQLLLEGKISDQIEYEDYGQILINSFSPVASFFEEDKYSIVGYYEKMYYALDQGIFENSAGSGQPCQITYKLDQGSYKFSSYRNSEMGDFGSNLKNFTRGFDQLESILLSTRRPVDQLLERVYWQAKEKGLENFSHKLEEIPGYQENVVYIDNIRQVPKDSLIVANQDEYQAALDRLGTENWTYYQGIIYYKPYGLALKTIVDDFEVLE